MYSGRPFVPVRARCDGTLFYRVFTEPDKYIYHRITPHVGMKLISDLKEECSADLMPVRELVRHTMGASGNIDYDDKTQA